MEKVSSCKFPCTFTNFHVELPGTYFHCCGVVYLFSVISCDADTEIEVSPGESVILESPNFGTDESYPHNLNCLTIFRVIHTSLQKGISLKVFD